MLTTCNECFTLCKRTIDISKVVAFAMKEDSPQMLSFALRMRIAADAALADHVESHTIVPM